MNLGDLKIGVKVENGKLKAATDQIKSDFKKAGDTIEKDLGKNTLGGMENKVKTLKKELLGVEVGTKEFKRLTTEIRNTESAMDKATGKSTLFAKGLKLFSGIAIAQGILSVGKSVISLGANLEQAQVSFEVMLGSAEKANILLQNLSEFAAKTPFELTGLRENAKLLLAMGVETQNLIPAMTFLGNAASGLSVDFNRLALAYGQVQAKGKLQGGELKQFTEAGVPIIKQLTESLGVSSAEFYKMVEAGQISADQVTQAFIDMSAEGGPFFDLMARQSLTLSGLWSNFKDELSILGEYIGSGLNPIFKVFVQGLISSVGILSATIQKVGGYIKSNFGESLIAIFEAIIKIVGVLAIPFEMAGSTILKIWSYVGEGLTSVISTFLDFINGVLQIITGNFSIGANVIYKSFVGMGIAISNVFDSLGKFLGEFAAFVGRVFIKLGLGLGAFWLDFVESAAKTLIGVTKNVGVFLNNLAVDFASIDWGTAWSGMGEWFGKVLDKIILKAYDIGANIVKYFKSIFFGGDGGAIGDGTIGATSSGGGNGGKKEYINIADQIDFGRTKAALSSIGEDFGNFFSEGIKQGIDTELLDTTYDFGGGGLVVPTETSGTGSSSSGGSGKSEAEKQAADELKALEDAIKEKEKIELASQKEQERLAKIREANRQKEIEARNDKLKDQLGELTDTYEDVGDIFEDEMKRSTDNIEDFGDEIEKLSKQLDDFEDDKKGLFERTLDFGSQKRREDLDRAAKLYGNVLDRLDGDAGLALKGGGVQVSELREYIKVKEEQQELDENIKNAQNEIEDLKTKTLEEQLILEDFSELKKNLDENYFALRKEIEEKITDTVYIEAAKQEIVQDNLIAKWEAVAAARRDAISSSTTSSSEALPGFAEGGYTGDGGKYDVAGQVHKGEYVVNQDMIKKVPGIVGGLEKLRTSSSIDNSKNIHIPSITANSQIDFEAAFEKIKFRI